MDASFHAFSKHLIILNLFRFENCSCLHDSLIAHITKIPISSKIKKMDNTQLKPSCPGLISLLKSTSVLVIYPSKAHTISLLNFGTTYM